MKQTMKLHITWILILLSISQLKGQDAQFSQFYGNPLYLAPSFAGSTHGTRFVGNYRDQWPKIPGTFVSYAFSADHFFSGFNSGMGLSFFSDYAGDGKLVTNNISYSYSYKVELARDLYFQPGLAAYYYSRKIDHSMLSFADQFFGSQFVGATSESLPYYHVQHADFAVSGLVYSKMYWGGITIDHLMNLSPELRTDYRYSDMRFSVFGGMKFITKKTVRNRNNEFLHAAFNYRYQARVHQLDIGAYYFRKPLMLGLWYRGIPVGNEYITSDALIFMLGVKYEDYTFTYSYDMTIGKLISATGGSHEVGIIISLDELIGKSKRRYRAIPCPEF